MSSHTFYFLLHQSHGDHQCDIDYYLVIRWLCVCPSTRAYMCVCVCVCSAHERQKKPICTGAYHHIVSLLPGMMTVKVSLSERVQYDYRKCSCICALKKGAADFDNGKWKLDSLFRFGFLFRFELKIWIHGESDSSACGKIKIRAKL